MRWNKTGDGARMPDGPPFESGRFLLVDDLEVQMISDGDFDGFVYSAFPSHEHGMAIIEWWRYPAELVSDEQPVAADYADSAE